MTSSRRERLLNLIGLGLLLVCFLISLGRIFGRYTRRDGGAGRTVIRFSHWQLESGVREAYDRIAAEYMALHPDVRVEQMPIPEQVYPNWLRTQLIGGTAPELIELGGTTKGETNEILANYFEPLTPYLERPNPYNAANDLARVPWRDTFIDGLSRGYNQELLQYYKIPSSMFTIRMFYNRALWRRIFGDERLPRTYEELLACCQRAAAFRPVDGLVVVPVAGSQANAPFLIQRLFTSQTQRLFYALARPGELYPNNEELAYDFLARKWSFDTPAVRDGLELSRGVGRFMPSGFLQLKREDALFIFSQGRALMTVTGSWDAPSIRSQAPFEVGVFDVPVPTGDDPRYGRNTMGIVSEAGAATDLNFGLTKQASPEKQARIIDFLHFMTSRESNRRFSDYSGWLPAVVGVTPRPEVQPFLPRMDGYPAGFNTGICIGENGGSFGVDSALVLNSNAYRIYDANGGPAAYARAVDGPVRPALARDFATIHRNQLDVLARQDTTLAAYRALGRADAHPGSADDWPVKVSELDELQTQEEIAIATRRWRMGKLGVSLER